MLGETCRSHDSATPHLCLSICAVLACRICIAAGRTWQGLVLYLLALVTQGLPSPDQDTGRHGDLPAAASMASDIVPRPHSSTAIHLRQLTQTPPPRPSVEQHSLHMSLLPSLSHPLPRLSVFCVATHPLPSHQRSTLSRGLSFRMGRPP